MKKLIKTAAMIKEELTRYELSQRYDIKDKFNNIYYRCKTIIKLSRQYEQAIHKGWLLAAEAIRKKNARHIQEFNDHIPAALTILKRNPIRIASQSEIYADLLQLSEDFSEVNYLLEQKTISVMTSPITLEDIYLGSFIIQLNLTMIPDIDKCVFYHVMALDPHPAGSDSRVTHPHISENVLCEGDGKMAIRHAIKQGRIYDFFKLIEQLLNNYNPHSAYVSLDQWDGTACYNCGDMVSDENLFFCEDCEHDFCDECSTYCHICDTLICLDCSVTCPACSESVCRFCLEQCNACKNMACKDCLEEDGQCNTCHDKRKENTNEENIKSNITQPEIHTHSLEQTPLPQRPEQS